MGRGKNWTAEEDAVLRKADRLTNEQMLRLLPNRTLHAIGGRMSYIGIRRKHRPRKRAVAVEPPSEFRNDCMPNPFDNRCCRSQFDVKFYLRRGIPDRER